MRMCSAKSPTNKRDGRCESILRNLCTSPLDETHDVHDSMSKATYILSKEPCTLSKLSCTYADVLVGRTQTHRHRHRHTHRHIHTHTHWLTDRHTNMHTYYADVPALEGRTKRLLVLEMMAFIQSWIVLPTPTIVDDSIPTRANVTQSHTWRVHIRIESCRPYEWSHATSLSHVTYVTGDSLRRRYTHYGMATISRLLKIIGLFCERAL